MGGSRLGMTITRVWTCNELASPDAYVYAVSGVVDFTIMHCMFHVPMTQEYLQLPPDYVWCYVLSLRGDTVHHT